MAVTPETAVGYLKATRSALQQISSSSSSSSKSTPPDTALIQSHFSLLSALIPLVPKSLLLDKTNGEDLVIDPVIIFVSIHSSWLTDDALHSALHCIAQLLDVHRFSNTPWSDACHLFDYLLGFATSSQPRLRTSSSQVIVHVLRSFGDSPCFLEAASEALTRLFEKSWSPVLSGGASAANVFGRVLDVLKACLEFMSTKFKIAVLGYFKAVFQIILGLEAHTPSITRGLEMCLERFCLHPNADVPLELLVESLCLVSISVSRNLPDAHQVSTAASLLKNGVAIVYCSNRGLCASKLPLVFDALRVLMGEPVEKAIDAAANAFKCLINACIDQSLILREPTVVEKLCSIVESLLDYHRTSAPARSMDLAFEVVWTMLDKLGACASYFMRGTMESLARMCEEFAFKKQAILLLGSLVKEKCGLNDVNIIAVLPQEQLMLLLADYRGLKFIEKPQLSHRRKREEFDVGSLPSGRLPYDCSVEMMAEDAIYDESCVHKIHGFVQTKSPVFAIIQIEDVDGQNLKGTAADMCKELSLHDLFLGRKCYITENKNWSKHHPWICAVHNCSSYGINKASVWYHEHFSSSLFWILKHRQSEEVCSTVVA